MIALDKEEVMCNVLQSPILVRSVQAKELFRDVSTEGLDRVRCRAIDKELVRDARRASDKGLVQDARRASDKGLVQGARRASDKGLVQGARRASDKGLVQGARRASDKGLVQGARRASDKGLVQGARRAKTARRAIAKVLRQVAKRASAGELSKDAMQNLKCANAKDEPAKSKGAGKTHASGTTGYATTEWLQQKEPWSHRGAPLPDSVALDIFDPKDASAPGHSVDELTG